MNLTTEERKKLLKCHNKLKDMEHMIRDCDDIYLSNVRDLSETLHTMHDILGFVPSNSDAYYADWILKEDKIEEKGE